MEGSLREALYGGVPKQKKAVSGPRWEQKKAVSGPRGGQKKAVSGPRGGPKEGRVGVWRTAGSPAEPKECL